MKSTCEEAASTEEAPVVLVPARRPYVGLLASAGLGLGAAALVLNSHPASLLGWALLALAPLGAITAAAMLLPGAHGLILEPDGFTIRYLWRDQFVAWAEVKAFAIDARGLPAFAWADGHETRRGARGHRHTVLPGTLPDSYGHSEGWRRRAVADEA